MDRHTSRPLLLLAIVILFAAGCGATSTPSPAPTASVGPVPATATPTAAPTTPAPTPPPPTSVPTPTMSLPAFACGETVRQAGSVPLARITGLTVVNDPAGTAGRITFTFRPEGGVAGIPEVLVKPATPPFTLDPSGLPLEVPGRFFVTITLLSGTALDDDYNPTFEGPFDIDPGSTPIVALRRAGDFEAVSSWVVGLNGDPCVRVLPPDGSGTLVIEIQLATG